MFCLQATTLDSCEEVPALRVHPSKRLPVATREHHWGFLPSFGLTLWAPTGRWVIFFILEAYVTTFINNFFDWMKLQLNFLYIRCSIFWTKFTSFWYLYCPQSHGQPPMPAILTSGLVQTLWMSEMTHRVPPVLKPLCPKKWVSAVNRCFWKWFTCTVMPSCPHPNLIHMGQDIFLALEIFFMTLNLCQRRTKKLVWWL